MEKITLRKFYDQSGNYKVVRCKTFEEAVCFWKWSNEIGHLTRIKTIEDLRKVYNGTPYGTVFCFSDEDCFADDEFYKSREIYDFEDIKLPKSNDIKNQLYAAINNSDVDLSNAEINYLIEMLCEKFQIKNKKGE